MDTEIGQERRAAIFPEKTRNSRSLGHSIWAQRRLTRGHCAINSGPYQRRGKPGDLVVLQAVSSEPVSGDFPVKQGKYREILRITPESGPRALCNALIFLRFLVEFPTRRNREIFWAEQGLLSLEQGNSSRIRERPHAATTGSGYEPDVQRSPTLPASGAGVFKANSASRPTKRVSFCIRIS